MRVSILRQGGFLDLDQRVDVDGTDVRVVERGVPRSVKRVGVGLAHRVEELAASVTRLPEVTVPPPEVPAYDDMLTEIEIDDGTAVRRLSLQSGTDAPKELWDLIGAVDDCAAQ